jgi:peptide/nickel transport system substrate-binding protein
MSRRGFLVRAGAVGLTTMPLGAFLAACGSKDQGGPALNQIRKGGTVTFAIDGTNGLIDPAVYTTLGDWMAVDCVCRGLSHIDFTSTTPTMGMARSVKVSGDGKTLTFTLRDGVKFHDGSTLTAQDVLRTFNRQLKDGDPSVPESSTRPLRGSTNRSITKVRAVDDMTFQIEIAAPDLTFVSRLSDISCRIVSAAALDKYGAEIGRNLVGAGPFKLAELKAQQSITLEAFSGYFGGAPVIDRLVLQAMPDGSALTAGLLGNQVQATSFAPHSAASRLGRGKKLTVHRTNRLVSVFVLMNASAKSLKELEVRQAVNHAIDRQQIIQQAFYGYADVPDGYAIPSSQVGHDASLADLSAYDVAKAKALIAQAGAQGRTVRLLAQNNGWYPKAAQIIEQNLTAIGLRPQVQTLDPGSFAGKVFSPADHELALWERNAYVPDPDNKVGNFFSSTGSYSMFGTAQNTLDKATNAKIDDLLGQGRQTSDPAARKRIYSEVQRLVAEEFAVISFVAQAQNMVVTESDLTGINTNALSTQRMLMEKTAYAG